VTAIGDDTSTRFEYYRGYPSRLRRDERRHRRGGLGCVGPFLLASLLGVATAVYGISEHPRWGELLRLIVFTFYFGYMLWDAFHTARHSGIGPYFQQRLGDIHTFARGLAIARSCQELDELAVKLGLIPLSTFGYNDDFAGEELTWHAPELGLATVSGLLTALRANPQTIREPVQVIEELAAVERALQIASDRGIPFCLLLYTAGATNSMEWEQRKGSCF
jgi:hypothetical protein